MGKFLAELQCPGAPQHFGDGSAASAISLQSLLMPEPWLPALQERKQVGRTTTICSLSAHSAGNSSSVEEKVNLVSTATEV